MKQKMFPARPASNGCRWNQSMAAGAGCSAGLDGHPAIRRMLLKTHIGEAPAGQMLIWDGLAHDKTKKSQHVNPCQSTGVWFTEPTPTTLVFLNDLLEWLLVKRTAQWDQAAWNEVTSDLWIRKPAVHLPYKFVNGA